MVKDNDQYNSLVDEIQELREQKVKLTEEQAFFTRNEECIAALRKDWRPVRVMPWLMMTSSSGTSLKRSKSSRTECALP